MSTNVNILRECENYKNHVIAHLLRDLEE